MNHATTVCAALLAAALLPLPSCSTLVREDRMECPSQLNFRLVNPELVPPGGEVQIIARGEHTLQPLAWGCTTLPALADGSFRLQVPKLPEVVVYGGLGLLNGHEKEGAWVVDAGQDGDPLFRFCSRLPTLDETTLVPVEFTKEYCRITVWIVPREDAAGDCPVSLTARSHTSGIDLGSGEPVEGIYRYSPEERAPGLYTFTVPRQADESLTLELKPKPGETQLPEAMGEILLWPYLCRSDGFSWQLKNLPDADIELDIWRSVVHVSLTDWFTGTEIYFEL